MAFIAHIPGTNPLPPIDPHPRRKGIGVLGLHEGRTLLLSLATRTRFACPVAGCDLNPEKISACRDAMPGLFYTTDYGSMLARSDVDIVAIYTPDSSHAEHVERALDAGKDVICTKPLTNSLGDARRILRAGERSRRRVMVGQSTRFFDPFLRQRASFERGELGAVEFADAHYVHRMDWYYDKSEWAAKETDWVFLGLSHPIDLLRWYLGPIARVQALRTTSSLGRKRAVRGADIYTVNVESKSGAIGRALGHYGCHELPSARNCIELMLFGNSGSSLAQYHDMRFVRTGPGNTEVTEDHLYAGRHYYFNSEVHGMHYGEFANYTDYFARAIIENTPNSPDLREGIETVCVMEAVRRSAATGECVDVAPLLSEVGLT